MDTLYHVVEFPTAEEAAGFVAALSRFLCSPQGAASPTGAEAVRVWSRRLPAGPGVELYLSDAALAATARAFAAPTVARTTSAAAWPPDCALVLAGEQAQPLGLVEAERLLGHP